MYKSTSQGTSKKQRADLLDIQAVEQVTLLLSQRLQQRMDVRQRRALLRNGLRRAAGQPA